MALIPDLTTPSLLTPSVVEIPWQACINQARTTQIGHCGNFPDGGPLLAWETVPDCLTGSVLLTSFHPTLRATTTRETSVRGGKIPYNRLPLYNNVTCRRLLPDTDVSLVVVFRHAGLPPSSRDPAVRAPKVSQFRGSAQWCRDRFALTSWRRHSVVSRVSAISAVSKPRVALDPGGSVGDWISKPPRSESSLQRPAVWNRQV